MWRRSKNAVSKYGNVPKRCNEGTTHQSSLEARRCNDLHMLQKAGAIMSLQAHPQPRFKLDVDGVHICDYQADFAYTRTDNGAAIVEDCKGVRTDVYKLKKRLMLALHGIEVEEVRR